MKVVISGAGPAGLLLAIKLVKRKNYQILICEKRPDMEDVRGDKRRTFPISIQQRGLEALREGANEEIVSELEKCGRWYQSLQSHPTRVDGKPRIISRPKSLSVDRNDIVSVLLKHLRERTEVGEGSTLEIRFNTSIEDINLDTKVITGVSNKGDQTSLFSTTFDRLVAADGSNSCIRNRLAQKGELEFRQERTKDSYKTLYLDLESSVDPNSQLSKSAIHTWFVGDIRAMALCAKEDCFSGVFVFPNGSDPFQDMNSSEEVQEYLTKSIPNLSRFVSDEEARMLLERPVSSQWTVESDRLHVRDCVLFVGDAAHSVSASLGQGCNSALEDIRVFTSLLDDKKDDWSEALTAFTTERLPDVHAMKIMSDFAFPQTPLMRIEWIIRMMLRKAAVSYLCFLPFTTLQRWFLKPLPTETLAYGIIRYRDALEQSRWWIDRVRRSVEK